MVKHTLPWQVYALDISPSHPITIAIGSLIEETNNYIKILSFSEAGEYMTKFTFEHQFSPTKVMWNPSGSNILASSSDNLKLWRIGEDVSSIGTLQTSRTSEYCGPITSFDWNPNDRNVIGTASIDSTCTIWDIERMTYTRQIITHNKEVNDIAFSHDPYIFASVGGDGSLRRFDLRNLEHCSILYETPNTPILRISWNKIDPNYVALLSLESNKVTIIDIRSAMYPCQELKGHYNYVNSLAWSPSHNCHLCSVGDDSRALIWDLRETNKEIKYPMMVYDADAPIINLNWSGHAEWICIGLENNIELLKL
jgi:DDB1- and CUL4-associated factor 7